MNDRDGAPTTTANGVERAQRLAEHQAAAFARLRASAERNAAQDPDEILAEVTEEVEAVRHARYQQQAATRRR